MSRNAFTLVELSIVLVILGLLVGGVLAGQSLVRSSELRAVLTERNNYAVAVNAFKEKYFAIPGDMTNATSFWGAQDPTPATCQATASTSALTCNGDGNGKLEFNATSLEPYRFWQHLANAGLIEGTYSGVATGNAVPKSRLAGAMWVMNYSDTMSGHVWFPDGSYGNVIQFGATSNQWSPVMQPGEAYNIDTKIDDGKPHKGNIRTFKHAFPFIPLCMNNSDDDYRINEPSKACTLLFIAGF